MFTCFRTLTVDCGNFLEEDATYEKHVKTIRFYRFFAFRLLRARFKNLLGNRVERVSQASRAAEES